MEQTPASKPERKAPNLMAAIGAVPILLTILAFFNINRVSDIPGLQNSATVAGESVIDNDIPAEPYANGKAYYVRVQAPQMGTPEWNGQEIVKDAIFYAEKDRMRWAKLNVASGEHFKDLKLSMTDFENRSDEETVRAQDLRDGDEKQWVLTTDKFKCYVKLISIDLDSDPDKTQPYPKVFTKATLQIRVTER